MILSSEGYVNKQTWGFSPVYLCYIAAFLFVLYTYQEIKLFFLLFLSVMRFELGHSHTTPMSLISPQWVLKLTVFFWAKFPGLATNGTGTIHSCWIYYLWLRVGSFFCMQKQSIIGLYFITNGVCQYRRWLVYTRFCLTIFNSFSREWISILCWGSFQSNVFLFV